MKKNEEFELQITDISVDGSGIGHFEGMTFFVKDALPGDLILAAVTKLKKTYGYARVVRILEESPDRVEEACPVAKTCGGCQIQALSYEKQLVLKSRIVRDDFIRIGGFDAEQIDSVMSEICGMEEPFHYRNKAQVPVGRNRDGSISMGYYASHSHRIVETEECLLGRPNNEEVLRVVKQYMEDYGVSPYDEETGKGLLRHVLIRTGFTSGQIMVCLVVNGNGLPHEDQLTQALSVISGMTSISINTNTKKTNVILGDKIRTIWGSPTIRDSIGDVEFEINPMSFYQVNPVQTEKLYSYALEFAGLTGQEAVWDLYCGIGTISLFLARKARMVYGVEIVPEAIMDARRNASNNGIENAKFFVGKAEEVLPEFYQANEEDEMSRPDVIVVDPPRKGCDVSCLNTMLAMAPDRIVYVSCDPATLARDCKILCLGGYEIRRIQPVDQFCHSMHVETVALLSRVQN